MGAGEYDTLTSLLTDSEEEQIVFVADPVLVRGTRLEKACLKQYDITNPTKLLSNPSADLVRPPLVSEPPLDISKPKEARFDKSLCKRTADDLTVPFKFDVLVQLTNFPAYITMHNLLHLSKETRDALKEALADSELLLTQTLLPVGIECQHCQCH